MADLLQTGASFLATQLTSYAAQTVTIRRGVRSTASVAAVPAGKVEMLDSDTDTLVERQMRDWLIQPSAYLIGGVAVDPERGDHILWTSGGYVHKFQVAAQGGEKPYRYSDRHNKLYRIHTEYIGIDSRA